MVVLFNSRHLVIKAATVVLIGIVLQLYDISQSLKETDKDDSTSQMSYLTYKFLRLLFCSLTVYFSVKFLEWKFFTPILPQEETEVMNDEKPSTRLSSTTGVWGDQHNEVDALGVGAHEARGYELDDDQWAEHTQNTITEVQNAIGDHSDHDTQDDDSADSLSVQESSDESDKTSEEEDKTKKENEVITLSICQL